MEKYTRKKVNNNVLITIGSKIWGRLWIIMLSIVAIITYIYVIGVTFNNIRYLNAYVYGYVVEEFHVQPGHSPTNTYFYFTYRIVSGEDILYASLGQRRLEMNDKVFGIRNGKNSMRIMEVNGKRAGSRYGIADYASVAIKIITIVVLIFYIKNKIKKR